MTEWTSTADRTLERARIFFRLSRSLINENREASAALLEAAIIYGRGVLFHLLREFRGQPGYEDWRKDFLKELRDDDICEFFRDTRNYAAHEEPVRMGRALFLVVNEMVMTVDVQATLTVKRGRPWYRRPPRILLEDLLLPFKKHLLPMLRRKLVKPAPPRAIEMQPSRAHAEWRFEHESWGSSDAADLVGGYLDFLEPKVRDAERRFS